MRSINEIRSILNNHKIKLFSDYPIKSLAIFGSYSRNQQNQVSDLDIIVEFSDNIGIRFIDLGDELEQLTGLKVDLVSRGGIKEKYFNSIRSDLIYV